MNNSQNNTAIARGIDIPVVEQVCLGRCAEGIAMRIAPGGPFFTQVTEADVEAILDAISIFSDKLVSS